MERGVFITHEELKELERLAEIGKKHENNKEKIEELRNLVYMQDIASPAVPEYVELHEKIQKILRFIDTKLLQ